VLTLPAAGKWHVEIYLRVDAATTTTQGFQWLIGGSATVTNSTAGAMFGRVNSANKTNAIFFPGVGSAEPNIALTGGTDYIFCAGTLDVTVAGTISINWAQNSSSLNATNLTLGSYIKAVRVA
jgi:hypothetical protein